MDIAPGYSSFLFNQLLQTQFYSVNNGGLSINLNISNTTYINKAFINTNDFSNFQQDNVFNLHDPMEEPKSTNANLKKEEPITQPPNISQSVGDETPPSQSDTGKTESEPTTNTEKPHTSTISVNNSTINIQYTKDSIIISSPKLTQINNCTVNLGGSNGAPIPPSPPTRYQSTLFRLLLSQYSQNKDNAFSSINFTSCYNMRIYPELNMLECFGERELVNRNRRRLKHLLYGKHCNMGTLSTTLTLQPFFAHRAPPSLHARFCVIHTRCAFSF